METFNRCIIGMKIYHKLSISMSILCINQLYDNQVKELKVTDNHLKRHPLQCSEL